MSCLEWFDDDVNGSFLVDLMVLLPNGFAPKIVLRDLIWLGSTVCIEYASRRIEWDLQHPINKQPTPQLQNAASSPFRIIIIIIIIIHTNEPRAAAAMGHFLHRSRIRCLSLDHSDTAFHH
jgi:hypothetical protein